MCDSEQGKVFIDIAYTTGSENENPTIINKNIVSGLMPAVRNLSFNCTETDPKKRAKVIIEIIYDYLVDYDG